MDLPDDAPTFPKLPFLVGDALLIAVALYVAATSTTPLPAAAIYTIAACVGLGAVLAAVPYVIDFNRRQDAVLSERQAALEALVRTTAAAAEQASIAAGGLHEIAELAQKNLRMAEHLPQKLQDRLHEFTHVRDNALATELEALQQEVNTLRASEAEKLEAAADKIHRSAGELARLDAGLRAQTAALDTLVQQAQERIRQATEMAVRTLEERSSRPPPPPSQDPGPNPPAVSPDPTLAAPPLPVPAPSKSLPPEPGTVSVPVAPPDAVPVVAAPAPAEATAGPAVPRKPSRRRSAEPSMDLLPDLLPAEPPRNESANTAGAAQPVPSRPVRSGEGRTRLTVTAYIGIGNKLFVRGEGPGLSWDRGVPLQFVSIGKWRWETEAATPPVRLKIFKNDQEECSSLGEVQLEPGHEHEVAAHF